ncbi:TPA: hypothetical protein ACGBZ1_004395 [Yersinia enterocolitica]
MTKSREEFEAWIAKWADTSKEAITALRNPDESDIDTYISDVIDDEALQFFIVGYAAWQAARESIEVDIDWPEANDDFWKDGEEGIYATGHTDGRQQTTDAVVKALRTAGIRIKGESEKC